MIGKTFSGFPHLYSVLQHWSGEVPAVRLAGMNDKYLVTFSGFHWCRSERIEAEFIVAWIVHWMGSFIFTSPEAESTLIAPEAVAGLGFGFVTVTAGAFIILRIPLRSGSGLGGFSPPKR